MISNTDSLTDFQSHADFIRPEQGITAEYSKFLSPYKHANDRYEFWIDQNTHRPDPDVGWKIHVNVSPNEVKNVSEKFVQWNLEHKYLIGAEVASGHIFTVYLGSKINLLNWTKYLEHELSDVLLPTVGGQDIPIGGIIQGRFVGEKSIFHTKSALKGITLLEDWRDALDRVTDRQAFQERAFSASNTALQKRYGDYYGGNDFPVSSTSKSVSFEQLWQSTLKQ